MNNRKPTDDMLYDVLNKMRDIKISEEVRKKSLFAFQNGLKEPSSLQNIKRKRCKLRQQVIGVSSTISAAGILMVLAFSTGILEESSTAEFISQENEGNQVQQNEPAVIEEQDEATVDAYVLKSPEYNSVNEYIEYFLNNLQTDSTDGAATRYDYDLHLIISSATYAKHFAALSINEEEIKKLNEIAEIGDLKFSADPETVEVRKQKMIKALSNF